MQGPKIPWGYPLPVQEPAQGPKISWGYPPTTQEPAQGPKIPWGHPLPAQEPAQEPEFSWGTPPCAGTRAGTKKPCWTPLYAYSGSPGPIFCAGGMRVRAGTRTGTPPGSKKKQKDGQGGFPSVCLDRGFAISNNLYGLARSPCLRCSTTPLSLREQEQD